MLAKRRQEREHSHPRDDHSYQADPCNSLVVMVSVALRLEKATRRFTMKPNVRRCSALEINGFAATPPPLGTDLFSIV